MVESIPVAAERIEKGALVEIKDGKVYNKKLYGFPIVIEEQNNILIDSVPSMKRVTEKLTPVITPGAQVLPTEIYRGSHFYQLVNNTIMSDFDAAMLEKIAKKANGKLFATGDAVPICIHTTETIDQKPRVIGYANKFHVRRLEKATLLCDFHILNDYDITSMKHEKSCEIIKDPPELLQVRLLKGMMSVKNNGSGSNSGSSSTCGCKTCRALREDPEVTEVIADTRTYLCQRCFLTTKGESTDLNPKSKTYRYCEGCIDDEKEKAKTR